MDRLMAELVHRLGRLPSEIGAHPALLISPNAEGYKDHAFGARAGPVVDAENIFHDLGHAAEFGPAEFEKRSSENGFRFATPRQWIFDRFCDIPATSQATDRELRTAAHQYHLMKAAKFGLNLKKFLADYAHLMRLMPDWMHVPGMGDDGRKAYCSLRLAEFIQEIRPEETFERLHGWLDATQRRFEAGVRRSYAPRQRFQADGSPCQADHSAAVH